MLPIVWFFADCIGKCTTVTDSISRFSRGWDVDKSWYSSAGRGLLHSRWEQQEEKCFFSFLYFYKPLILLCNKANSLNLKRTITVLLPVWKGWTMERTYLGKLWLASTRGFASENLKPTRIMSLKCRRLRSSSWERNRYERFSV